MLPHHVGLVPQPFKAGAPDLTLTAADEKLLEGGKTVTRQVVDKTSNVGNALAVQDVAAPREVGRFNEQKSHNEKLSEEIHVEDWAEMNHEHAVGRTRGMEECSEHGSAPWTGAWLLPSFLSSLAPLSFLLLSHPPQIVLDRILDFDKYPKMVSGVSECGNYQVQ